MANGSEPTPAQAKAYAAEKQTAIIRFAVIAFNIASYWAWIYPAGWPGLAGIVSVVAGVYAVYDLVGQPYRHFPIIQTAAWTAVTDGALITLWIQASGGGASPYYLLWYLSLVAVTFRYSWRGTLLAALAYSASYVLLLVATHETVGPAIAIRVAYILLVGALGALLARESTRVFQERYEIGLKVKEARRFKALAEATPEAVLVVRDGRILDANPAFCALVGLPYSEVVGRPALPFADPESRPLVAQRLQNPRDDPFEGWLLPAHGPRRLVRLQSRSIEWDGGPARVATMRDITQERASEEARGHAREAEMEVRRLREMDRFKTDFINAAAHELNTPLTPIRLQIHMLKRRIPASAPERETVDILDRNLERLGGLVEEMLDVARLQSGRLLLEPHAADLAALVRDAAATFRPGAADKGLHLEVGHLPSVVANVDAKRVTQVLYNLLSNALKFTPRGGRIEVSLQEAGDEARITVRDTGLGLTPQEIGVLFQPFVQLHRDRITAAGTGLGLYISRGIAGRHGGTLTCDSLGPGLGAAFTLRLPIAGPANAAAAANAEGAGPASLPPAGSSEAFI